MTSILPFYPILILLDESCARSLCSLSDTAPLVTGRLSLIEVSRFILCLSGDKSLLALPGN